MRRPKIKMPEWLTRLPADGYINAKEICSLFGYSPNTKVSSLIKLGSIPEPTARSGFKLSGNTLQWRVKELRRYIREQ